MSDVDLKIYDADQIRCTFAGYSISKGLGASGYADGVFVKIEQKDPSFSYKVGTDGTVSRSKTNARLTVITVRVMQTNSATNGVLSALLQTDENNPNGAGVGTFALEDLQGTTVFRALKCWVSGPPSQSWGQEADAREWELHAVRSSIVVGGT